MAGPYRNYTPGATPAYAPPGGTQGYMPQDLLDPVTARSLVHPQSYTSAYAPTPTGTNGTLPGLNSYDSIGKTQTFLVGQPGTVAKPGELSNLPEQGIYAPPQQVPQMGALEGLFRGVVEQVGGFMPADIRAHVENGLGVVANLLDIPFEFFGNLPQIPLPNLIGPPGTTGFVNQQQYFAALPETEAKKEAEDAIKNDPANGLYYIAQYMRFHETEIAHGLGVSPLVSDFFVPTNNLGDQIMRTLGLLGLPGRLTSRVYAESAQRNAEGTILRADPNTLNPELQRLRSELESGKITRTEFYDELARSGFAFSNSIWDDMLWEMITDPLVVASFGTGLALKAANTSGRLAMVGRTVRAAMDVLPDAERASMDAYAVGKIFDKYASRTQTIGQAEAMKLVRDSDRFEWLAQHHPQFEQDELAKMSSRGRAMVALDPLIKKAAEVSRVLNSPFDLFGQVTHRGFRNGERIAAFSSTASVEGLIQAYGPQRVLSMQNLFDKMGVPDQLKEILGRMGANVEVGVNKDAMNRMVTAKGSTPAHMPDAIIRSQSEVYHSRLALQAEGWTRRIMTQFLPTSRFGKEAIEETMARQRKISELKLMEMAGPAADPAAIKALVDHADNETLALIEHMYYGGVVIKSFHDARALARSALGDAAQQLRKKLATGGKGGGPMVGKQTVPRIEAKIAEADKKLQLWGERATIIGPRELTWQAAGKVLNKIRKGDVTAAREAIEQYDLLFNNFAAKGLDDDTMMRNLETFLQELRAGGRENGRLVNEIERNKLPRELFDWYNKQLDFKRRSGDVEQYKVGLAPEQGERWRAVYDKEDNLVGINAWAETVPDVADTPRVSSFSVIRDRLFRPIRGERQLEEARRDFRVRAVNDYGLSRSQANALFGAIRRKASEANTMPRGLTPGELNDLITHMGWTDEEVQRVGMRGMTRLVASAFEGHAFTVGVTQKITGRLKVRGSNLPGANWLGVVAERLYPMARFSYNPIFLAQEAVEPFFWNLLRGIKPGLRWTREDLKSFEALRRSGFLGEWADQWEYSPSALLLFGQREARRVAGPGTAIGKFSDRVLGEGRRVGSLAELKRLNYVRQNSRDFGFAFKKYIEDTDPQFWDTLVREAGTSDPARIGNYYWLNKALYSPDAPDTQAFLFDANLPSNMGASAHQMPQALAKFHNFVTFDALRTSVRKGEYDEVRFRAAMNAAKMNADYIDNAWAMASHIGPAKWWQHSQDAYALAKGNTRAAKNEARMVMRVSRAIVKQRASILGYSEEEYLARQMTKPMEFLDSNSKVPLGVHYQLVDPENTQRFYGYKMLEANDPAILRVSREARAVSGTPMGAEAEMQRLIEDAAGRQVAKVDPAEWLAQEFDPRFRRDPMMMSEVRPLFEGTFGLDTTEEAAWGIYMQSTPNAGTRKGLFRGEFHSLFEGWQRDVRAKARVLPLAEPSGETVRLTASAIDGSADGPGRDLIHIAGPGLDYESLVQMAQNVLGSENMERIVLGHRRIPSMFHMMTQQLPDDLVWRYLRDHVAFPDSLHENRLRVEALKAENDLSVQSDLLAGMARDTRQYLKDYLTPGARNSTDYFDMNRIDMQDVKPGVLKGKPNTGIKLHSKIMGEPHTFYGWYDDKGDLVATADVTTDTQALDFAVNAPTTPGGPVPSVDLANMELEGLGTPAFPVPKPKPSPDKEVLQLFVKNRIGQIPRVNTPEVAAWGTKMSEQGKGYAQKLAEYIDSVGIHKWHDITGRGSYDLPGSMAAQSLIRKMDKASLADAKELLASRMLAGFSFLARTGDLDPQEIIRTMQSVLEAGSGKHPRAVPAQHLAIEQMLDFGRIGGDEIIPSWEQRAFLESLLPAEVRQVDTINPSKVTALAHGYQESDFGNLSPFQSGLEAFGHGDPELQRNAIRLGSEADLLNDEVNLATDAGSDIIDMTPEAQDLRHHILNGEFTIDDLYNSPYFNPPNLTPERLRLRDAAVQLLQRNQDRLERYAARNAGKPTGVSPAIFSKMQQDYREWAARANADALLGRTDWTAADIQTLNTARYRQAMGHGVGNDADQMMNSQYATINFELEPHPGTDLANAMPSQEWVRNTDPSRLPEFNKGEAMAQGDIAKYWASQLGEISGVSVIGYSVGPSKHITNYVKGRMENIDHAYWEREARAMVQPDDYQEMVRNGDWDEFVSDFITDNSVDNTGEHHAFGPGVSIIVTGSPESIEAAVVATGGAFQRREVVASFIDYVAKPGKYVKNNWDQSWVTDFVIPQDNQLLHEPGVLHQIDKLWPNQDLVRQSIVMPNGDRAIRVYHEVGLVTESGLKNLLADPASDSIVAELESAGVKLQRGVVDMYRHKVDIPDTSKAFEFFDKEGSFVDETGRVIRKDNLEAFDWESRLQWRVDKLSDPWIRDAEVNGFAHVATALRHRLRGQALTETNLAYQKYLWQFVDEWRSRDVNLPPPLRGYHFQMSPKGVRGATKIENDLSASIFLLKHANPTTVPHELIHQMVPHMDDSMIEAITDAYSAATGYRKRVSRNSARKPYLNNTQEEWLAEEFVKYASTGKVRNANLQSMFNMMGKLVKEDLHLRQLPEAHPRAKELFDQLLGQANSGLSAVPFNPDEYRHLAAARYLMSAAEDQAHTTHYFRRGRSFLERSVNHPYLGYYPASYMWGKVIPELIRFLVKEPFGIQAPMGGYMLASHVSQAVMLQLNTDPDFRQWVTDHPQLIRFIQMMLPGTPWDIPVNLPAWMRHSAEIGATNQIREAAGQQPKSIDFLSEAAQSANYAFGIGRSFQTTTSILKEFNPPAETGGAIDSTAYLQAFGLTPQNQDVADAESILTTR